MTVKYRVKIPRNKLPLAKSSILVSLELMEPRSPEESARSLERMQALLGDPEIAKLYDKSLVLSGRRAMRVAPLRRGGTLPFWELLDVIHLQGELLSEGALLRGVVWLGDAAARGGVLSGSGVEEVNRVHDELDPLPRVIVDPRLFVEVELNADARAPHHDVKAELGYIQELVHRGDDGVWFVDSLKAYPLELDDEEAAIGFLKAHQKLVRDRLSLAPRLGRDARIATWMWAEHNRVAGEHLKLSPQAPSLYTFPPGLKAP